MQKLRVIGLKSACAEITDTLAKSGNFEVIRSTVNVEVSDSVDKLLAQRQGVLLLLTR